MKEFCMFNDLTRRGGEEKAITSLQGNILWLFDFTLDCFFQLPPTLHFKLPPSLHHSWAPNLRSQLFCQIPQKKKYDVSFLLMKCSHTLYKEVTADLCSANNYSLPACIHLGRGGERELPRAFLGMLQSHFIFLAGHPVIHILTDWIKSKTCFIVYCWRELAPCRCPFYSFGDFHLGLLPDLDFDRTFRGITLVSQK